MEKRREFKHESWFKLLLKRLFNYKPPINFRVGDRVYDDLTREEAIIIGITWQDGEIRELDGRLSKCYGCVGIWLDNDYLDGARHPWEISEYGE